MCFTWIRMLCLTKPSQDYEPLDTSDSIEWEQCSSPVGSEE